MDRNALDWLFSTAPQALAALVGLIFAGVAFIVGAIDKQVEQDDSREDICKAMKQQIHVDKKTLFFLDRAQDKLSAKPVSDIKGIVDDLRMAVEWAIDEVVFRGLAPRRFKGSDLTDWDKMEKMANSGPQNVIELHDIYDQLSSLIHLGYTTYASSATVTKLQNLHGKIMTVYRRVYP